MQDQVAGAEDYVVMPRPPSPQTPPTAPLGKVQGVPRPAKRHSSPSMSWAVFWWDMPGTPPGGGVWEAFQTNARAPSTDSSQCGGAVALLRAPPGWPSSSPYL
ncbi:hypothetical protein AMECASPLE_027719 [Ameca splendens]|uniref:Uncharacterized protein n=1 Tax=Ameca splendens TaxID=208324 RepID=A0ABV1ABN2_9TELE